MANMSSHKRNEKRHVGDKVLGKRRTSDLEAVPCRGAHQGDFVAASVGVDLLGFEKSCFPVTCSKNYVYSS